MESSFEEKDLIAPERCHELASALEKYAHGKEEQHVLSELKNYRFVGLTETQKTVGKLIGRVDDDSERQRLSYLWNRIFEP